VARDLLLDQHDLDVVQVGDIANLRRAVLLTLQLSEYGVRFAVALNMADELRSIDDAPDVDALAAITGVPFLTVSALRRWNLAKLRATQTKRATIQVSYPPAIEAGVAAIRTLLEQHVSSMANRGV